MNSARKTSNLVQLHGKPDFEGTADEFGRAISEAGIEVSLATIQGYLLVHKRDPIMAQQKVGEWIEEIRVKQAGVPKVEP
jgi:F420-0:gamma-glutamyl ligase